MPTLLNNFTAETTADGYMLIKGVEISVIELEQFNSQAITEEIAKDFVATFKLRQQKGKVGAFVRLNHKGPGIGRMVDLYIDGPYLKADLLITSRSAMAAIERGDLTERSIEYYLEPNMLTAVALLSGAMGADSEEFRDLTVTIDETKEFGLAPHDNGLLTKYLVGTKQQKDQPMALSKEDLEAIGNLVDSKIAARFSKDPLDIESEVREAGEKAISAERQELQKQKRELTVKGHVDALLRQRVPYTRGQLVKMFEKFGDNFMAMEVEYKRLAQQTTEDASLEVEKEFGGDVDLQAEFKEYRENNPESKMSFSRFADVVNRKPVAREGRQVIQLPNVE